MMSAKRQAWAFDQLGKSLFFQSRLHEWGLLEVAKQIEGILGETLDWQLTDLNISDIAWNRVIHSGIKPVIVFANPAVLTTIERSVSYYRMLAMVSQKSMNQIGMSTARFEQSANLPNDSSALVISQRLNLIISHLLENDLSVSKREFDLWRGMAAGTQAQGSWQNQKGDQIETILRRDLMSHLKKMGQVGQDHTVDIQSRVVEFQLEDGRTVRMGSEPDIKIYDDFRIYAAVEVKGGIDPAGVLERVGAAIKSLSRAKGESPGAITILLMPGVSMSDQARRDIESNKANVNYWFAVEDILEDSVRKQEYYNLLGLAL